MLISWSFEEMLSDPRTQGQTTQGTAGSSCDVCELSATDLAGPTTCRWLCATALLGGHLALLSGKAALIELRPSRRSNKEDTIVGEAEVAGNAAPSCGL